MKSSREIRALWPVTKAGVPLTGVYPWGPIVPAQFHHWNDSRMAPSEEPAARKLRSGFSPHETRHSFAIEGLPKPGASKSQPYLYTCVSCKWSFRVNDRSGSIVTLDDAGHPLAEPESARRAATFANGPCPAFGPVASGRITQLQLCGWFVRMRHRLARRLEALLRRWSGEESGHMPRDSHATTMIMPQDLLR